MNLRFFACIGLLLTSSSFAADWERVKIQGSRYGLFSVAVTDAPWGSNGNRFLSPTTEAAIDALAALDSTKAYTCEAKIYTKLTFESAGPVNLIDLKDCQ